MWIHTYIVALASAGREIECCSFIVANQRIQEASTAAGKGNWLLSGVPERNMDRSVDSIGSCSLDVDADSTDFSGEWSEFNALLCNYGWKVPFVTMFSFQLDVSLIYSQFCLKMKHN